MNSGKQKGAAERGCVKGCVCEGVCEGVCGGVCEGNPYTMKEEQRLMGGQMSTTQEQVETGYDALWCGVAHRRCDAHEKPGHVRHI